MLLWAKLIDPKEAAIRSTQVMRNFRRNPATVACQGAQLQPYPEPLSSWQSANKFDQTPPQEFSIAQVSKAPEVQLSTLHHTLVSHGHFNQSHSNWFGARNLVF